MPNPAPGNPISFEDLNTNSGLPQFSPTSDLETLGLQYGLKPVPQPNTGNWSDGVPGLSMSEFHSKSGNTYYPPGMVVDEDGGTEIFYLIGGGTYNLQAPHPASPFSSRLPFANSYAAPTTITITVPDSGLPGPATNFSGVWNFTHPAHPPFALPIQQVGTPAPIPPTPSPTAPSPTAPTPTPQPAPQPVASTVTFTPTGPVTYLGLGQVKYFTLLTTPSSLPWSIAASGPAGPVVTFPTTPTSPGATTGTGPHVFAVFLPANNSGAARSATLTLTNPVNPVPVGLIQPRAYSDSDARIENQVGSVILLDGGSGTFNRSSPVSNGGPYPASGQAEYYKANADFSVPFTLSVPGPRSPYTVATPASDNTGGSGQLFLLEAYPNPSPLPRTVSVDISFPDEQNSPYADYTIVVTQDGAGGGSSPSSPTSGPSSFPGVVRPRLPVPESQ